MRSAVLGRLHCNMRDAAAAVIGALLFSAAMNMFLLPAEIVLGGMTGVATVLGRMCELPLGLIILLLNMPLLLVSARCFGSGFILRTLVGVVLTSAAVDSLDFFPVTVTDPLLCSLLGGLTMGASIGVLMSRGFTTGGTDLIAGLIKARLPGRSVGSLVTLTDLVIIVGAALLTRELEGILYSLICIFVSGRATDFILAGARRGGLALIISSSADRIASEIMQRLKRGVTLLSGRGGWSGEERQVLLCVVNKREVFYLRELVLECDPSAFMILAEANDIIGEGFARRNHLV